MADLETTQRPKGSPVKTRTRKTKVNRVHAYVGSEVTMFEVSVEVPGALARRVVGERDSYALAEERCIECFRAHFHPPRLGEQSGGASFAASLSLTAFFRFRGR